MTIHEGGEKARWGLNYRTLDQARCSPEGALHLPGVWARGLVTSGILKAC